MSGLVLKLAPRERILVNGAVVENGDKRARLAVLTPHANILRLRDAIHPETVDTPVRRVCYIAQLVLSGDILPGDARHQMIRGIEQLSQVFTDRDSRSQLDVATAAVLDEQYYQAMKSLRSLLPREARLMAATGT